MKLREIAAQAIEIIKERGAEGINNAELAQLVGTPKRRVYDVIAILKAANLITTERDGSGTRIYWTDESQELQQQSNGTSFVASKLRVYTDGSIYNVANRGSEVVIELDDQANLLIETLND